MSKATIAKEYARTAGTIILVLITQMNQKTQAMISPLVVVSRSSDLTVLETRAISKYTSIKKLRISVKLTALKKL